MDTKTISQLRAQTGAGIMDCKKALEEAANDIEKAAEILRKNGIAKAAKRAGREASEGIIMAGTNDEKTEGYMVEVNSETDFVARNEQFQSFAKDVFELLKENKPSDREALLSLSIGGRTVKEKLDEMVGAIGEKLDIKNAVVISDPDGVVESYIHGEGRIGVLVAMNGVDKDSQLPHDIAMQIAAAMPKYLSPEDVPAEELAKEKEIYREQLKNEGKPEAIMEKIIEGKVSKYYEEVCLLKQQYIKDDKLSVEKVLGDNVSIKAFARYQLGGGSC